jgi:hypothetical protein
MLTSVLWTVPTDDCLHIHLYLNDLVCGYKYINLYLLKKNLMIFHKRPQARKLTIEVIDDVLHSWAKPSLHYLYFLIHCLYFFLHSLLYYFS